LQVLLLAFDDGLALHLHFGRLSAEVAGLLNRKRLLSLAACVFLHALETNQLFKAILDSARMLFTLVSARSHFFFPPGSA